MVSPRAFGFDPDTASSNRFQTAPGLGSGEIRRRGREEFDQVAGALRTAGIDVIVCSDQTGLDLPDAVFPNNWISTHHDGTVVLYPMCAPRRRLERREDIVERLGSECGFAVKWVVDLGPNEMDGRFLEGTGSLVFDHVHRVVYACISPRTDEGMVCEAGELLGYETVVFQASDTAGFPVYHTNVVMSVGQGFALVCSEAIIDEGERRAVIGRLASTGRTLLEITRKQMSAFGANILELRSEGGEPVLAASARAWNALGPEQQESLQALARVVRVPIPTIESVGGGSVRCMIAEIFLPPSR